MADKWHDKINKTNAPKRTDGKTRHGSYSKSTYRQMIRKMCIHCCGNQAIEVRECPASDCPLWTARLGGTKPEPLPKELPTPPLDCI